MPFVLINPQGHKLLIQVIQECYHVETEIVQDYSCLSQTASLLILLPIFHFRQF